MRLRIVFLGLMAVGLVLTAMFAESTATALTDKTAKGPLAGLPSAAGAHLNQIKALADDSWLNLGAPAPDPKWGTARGRSWTPKMAYAPELRAAFLYGEGVHAFVKPDSRLQDDLWAYDINAHRWICVYPGAEVKSLEVKLDKNGFTVTPDGEPLPVAQMGHGYEGMSYDTDARKFVMVPCESPYSRSKLGTRLPALETGMDRKRIRVCPWFYNPMTDKWERQLVQGAYPEGTNMESVVQYVPSRKQVFFLHVKDVWFYDPAANTWTKASPKGPLPPFGIDAVACHDTKRDRIYVGGGSYPTANALWIYDVKTNTWIDPKPEGQPGKGNGNYAGGYATMQYDALNDVALLNLYRAPAERRGLYIYDPQANRWSTEPRPLPKEITERKNLNAFYDPELNVHFYHAAGDSDPDGTMWVYRYKNAKEGAAPPDGKPSEATRREPGLADRSDILLACDFEEAEWWRTWGITKQPANTSLIEGEAAFTGKGKSLKVTVPHGETTGANFHFRFRERTGSEPEEIYFRYYLKLDPDWRNAVDGGKLPGFAGIYNRAGWGGRQVNGSDGWSARGSFRRPGQESEEIGFYCYHADMRGKYGDIWKFQPALNYNQWYCVELYCKLNTPGKEKEHGKNDGILKAWIDGQPAFEKTNFRFRDVDTLKIETIWVNVYHGGTTPVPKDVHLYLDNMVIASKPIGPLKMQTPQPKPKGIDKD